ncbi:MAG TPA: 50S ribosomal protein L4 [Candidatus Limnocylindrales bacterium]|nr:50S ribosomal protein L4 [Candidatus Limnocylindrales bacterium]
METSVYNRSNQEVGRVSLPAIFETRVNDSLLFDQVLSQLASRRAGTHATKTRGFVSGGGKKPWKQKGTGRARAGSSRSPIWRGGAIIFGPQPRSYDYRLPRSSRKGALASALAQKARDGQLKVVDALALDQPKTKELAALLSALGVADSVLVVIGERDRNIELAGRNIPRVLVLPVEGLNVYDILKYKNLLVAQETLAAIQERLEK